MNTSGDEDPDDAADMTNTTDADTFETLRLGLNCTTGITPDLPSMPPSEAPEDLALPPEDLVPESVESEATPPATTVFIDPFPHGSPGAPISGVCNSSPMDHTGSEALIGLIWSPFSSECDWEIARWAKTRSPTSSAMSDLLAISGVRSKFFVHFVSSLMPSGRLLKGLGCRTTQSRS